MDLFILWENAIFPGDFQAWLQCTLLCFTMILTLYHVYSKYFSYHLFFTFVYSIFFCTKISLSQDEHKSINFFNVFITLFFHFKTLTESESTVI